MLYPRPYISFTKTAPMFSGMRQRLVDPKMYFGVEAEVRNKTQELITLRARLKSLQEKLIAAEDNQEEVC